MTPYLTLRFKLRSNGKYSNSEQSLRFKLRISISRLKISYNLPTCFRSYGEIYERIPSDAMALSYSHEHLGVSGSEDSESYSPLDNEDVKLGDDYKMKGGK